MNDQAKKPDEKIFSIRLPIEIIDAIERERDRATKKAGAEVTTAAVVRGVLERALNVKYAKT